MNVGNDLVQQYQAGYTPHRKNEQEEHNEFPRDKANFWSIVKLEREPGAYIDKACTVEHELNGIREDLVLVLDSGFWNKLAVPGNRTTCQKL